MTKEELIAENKALKEQLSLATFQLSQLQKMIFGSRRERFVREHPDIQLNLFSDPDEMVEALEPPTPEEKITVERKKSNQNHPSRNAFPEPSIHLEELMSKKVVSATSDTEV